MTVTGVENNNITFTNDLNGGTVRGIYFNNNDKQIINGDVSGNSITIGDLTDSTAYGIYFFNLVGTQTIGVAGGSNEISGNTITFGDITNSTAYGLFIDNFDVSQTINSRIGGSDEATKNTITIGAVSGGGAYGIYFLNRWATGTQSLTQDIVGNEINIATGENQSISNNAVVYGLEFLNTAGAQNIGSDAANTNILSNEINLGDISNSTAYGIYFSNDDTQTFKGSIGGLNAAEGNTLTFGDINNDSPAIFNVTGFYFLNKNSQTLIQNGSISYNTITIGDTVNINARGIIFVDNSNTGLGQTVSGDITDNVINIGAVSGQGNYNITAFNGTYGIYFLNGTHGTGTQNFEGTLSNNSISIAAQEADQITNSAFVTGIGAYNQQGAQTLNSIGAELVGNVITIGNLYDDNAHTSGANGILIRNAGTQTVNFVAGNTVNIGDLNHANARGLMILNTDIGEQTVTHIRKNDINIGTVIDRGEASGIVNGVYGMYFSNYGTLQQFDGNLAENTLNIASESTQVITAGANVKGIYFFNYYGTQNIGSGGNAISNNNIYIGMNADKSVINTLTDSDIQGIYFLNNNTRQDINASVENNTVSLGNISFETGNSFAVSGISFENDGITQTLTGDVLSNQITLGSISNNNAALETPQTDLNVKGLVFDNATGTQTLTGNVSDNHITAGDVSDTGNFLSGISFINGGKQELTENLSENSVSVGTISGGGDFYGIYFESITDNATQVVGNGFYGNNVTLVKDATQGNYYFFKIQAGTVSIKIGNGETNTTVSGFAKQNKAGGNIANTNNVSGYENVIWS
jgi:hypothetical protein